MLNSNHLPLSSVKMCLRLPLVVFLGGAKGIKNHPCFQDDHIQREAVNYSGIVERIWVLDNTKHTLREIQVFLGCVASEFVKLATFMPSCPILPIASVILCSSRDYTTRTQQCGPNLQHLKHNRE